MSTRKRAIGIGATSQTGAEDVIALVRAALGPQRTGTETKLAALDRRSSLAYVVGAALQLEVVLFTTEQLGRIDGTTTFSTAAMQALGLPSVAEACALAAVGRGAKLTVPRRTGRRCTCAIAERIGK